MMEVFAYDRYGRAIGLLYWRDNGRGLSINLAMVRQGYAYCLRHFRGEYGVRALGLLAAEEDARRERLGVWAEARGDVRPWAYRAEANRARWRMQRGARVGCFAMAVGVVLVVALIVNAVL